jgi:5-methylcytosine-specific restriction protein B
MKSITAESIKAYPPLIIANPTVQNQLQRLWEQDRKFVILSGPPGVGKTRAVEDFVKQTVVEKSLSQPIGHYRLSKVFPDFRTHVYSEKEIDSAIAEKNIKFIWDICVLHPQYAYEDLIRGYRLFSREGVMSLEVREGLLGFISRVVKSIQKASPSDSLGGVLILDEINRAPIGQLFGEAVYAIDRRDTEVVTPYDLPSVGSTFSIPSSLYLMGTMNSIDRATSGFDFALRRRFSLLNMYPDEQSIVRHYEVHNPEMGKYAQAFFTLIRNLVSNATQTGAIPKSELVIGHSYFMVGKSKLDEAEYLECLAESYLYRIVPILIDYKEQGLLEYKDSDIDRLPASEIVKNEVEIISDKFQQSVVESIRQLAVAR